MIGGCVFQHFEMQTEQKNQEKQLTSDQATQQTLRQGMQGLNNTVCPSTGPLPQDAEDKPRNTPFTKATKLALGFDWESDVVTDRYQGEAKWGWRPATFFSMTVISVRLSSISLHHLACAHSSLIFNALLFCNRR